MHWCIVISTIFKIVQVRHTITFSNRQIHQSFIWSYYSHIKTHNSESRGQEETGCTQRTSELFTGSTAVKLNFVNTKLATIEAIT